MEFESDSVTTEEHAPFEAGWAWRAGASAGILAAVGTVLVIAVVDLGTLQGTIAGLYGFEGSLAVGLVAHLVHGTLFGVVFAAVLSDPGLYRLTEWRWKTVAAGVAYGLVLAVAGAGIIMPIWLGLVGFPTTPAIPFVSPDMLSWHLVYGAVLGGAFARVDGRFDSNR